jgi:hypothetical protein
MPVKAAREKRQGEKLRSMNRVRLWENREIGRPSFRRATEGVPQRIGSTGWTVVRWFMRETRPNCVTHIVK